MTERTNRRLMSFVKVCRARAKDGLDERWAEESVVPTVNLFDVSPSRFVTLIVGFPGTRRHNSTEKRKDGGHEGNGT